MQLIVTLKVTVIVSSIVLLLLLIRISVWWCFMPCVLRLAIVTSDVTKWLLTKSHAFS